MVSILEDCIWAAATGLGVSPFSNVATPENLANTVLRYVDQH